MPVYEYACMKCRKVVSVLVRSIERGETSVKCPECGGKKLHRLISGFAFHRSLLSKVEQLDPKYDKMIDAANPDLSFDSLVKQYKLDQRITKSED
jgi:putative FmdB family regulatory protein